MEQQRGSGLRARASFLVLTQTVLLGLGELSETQHLLTAQRVYMLLEPSLLEVTRDDTAQVRQDEEVYPENVIYFSLTDSLMLFVFSVF